MESLSKQEIRDIALRFYAPLRTGDTSEVFDILSENWEDIPLNDGQTTGPKGFIEMVHKLRSFLPDLVWNIDSVVVEDDQVVVRSLISGKPQGDILGIHYEANKIEFMAIDMHQISDGKIVKTWHVEDKMSILKQFGVPHLSFR
jgi:predicted ester cyclase